MSAHTPGPWTFDDGANGLDVFVDDDSPGRLIVADVVDDQPEYQANARLISAAPDMLAVLREIAVLLNTNAMHEFTGEPWVVRLRAAIAKTEGTA